MFQRKYLEAKMNSKSFLIIVNILLALTIYLSAEVGRMLGIKGPTLEISVIWPATGFSLAGVLLFGFGVWPGIFIGNFIYNLLHFFLSSNVFFGPIFSALIISSGSLVQALTGGYILRKYSSRSYFNSVKDVFLFLSFGGILTCFIASTIGISTLFLSGAIPWEMVDRYWLTFWMGDVFGIFIFTPFIIVWLLHKPIVKLKDHIIEAILMFISLIGLSFYAVFLYYPVAHFYIPISIWWTYRFQMHGATLAILFTSLILVSLTSVGYGSFYHFMMTDALPILVSFLGILVATSLILAAVVNEREIATLLLKQQNIDLKENIDKRIEKIEQLQQEMIIKEKLASLGMMTLSIAEKMKEPLNNITNSRNHANESLQEMHQLVNKYTEESEPEIVKFFRQKTDKLQKNLQVILDSEKKSERIINYVRELSKRTASEKIVVKLINLQTLLNQCLESALSAENQKYPGLKVDVRKQFTRTVPMIPALPEELSSVFYQIIEFAIDSMQIKKLHMGEEYKPILYVRMIDEREMIELEIETNGEIIENDENPITSEQLELENELLFKMPVAQDIIVFLHRGEMLFESNFGQHFKAVIKLPRTF
jgi:integral membrane sensor domain MASE1